MTINQLTVFAQNGEKNTTGLTQADGFPSTQKPARQWFNWLFHAMTTKINELVVSVNDIAQNKANLGGSNTQRFKVEDAVDNDHAVSKGQLDAEATLRSDADSSLQQQIDGLTLSVLERAWPIGSVYENSFDTRNPSHQDLLGFGTWVRFAEGKTTIGYKNGDSDFGVIGQTGGKKGHKMTTSNLIAHLHRIKEGSATPSVGGAYTSGDDMTNNIWGEVDSGSAGEADPDAIPTLPPYVVTAKWTRTA